MINLDENKAYNITAKQREDLIIKTSFISIYECDDPSHQGTGYVYPEEKLKQIIENNELDSKCKKLK